METLFVLTHATMLICIIGIIGVSILNQFENDQLERSSAAFIKNKLSISWKNITNRKEPECNLIKYQALRNILIVLLLYLSYLPGKFFRDQNSATISSLASVNFTVPK
jgi:hypothetical protein